ncbi:hypothetical protein MTO96_016404 [Rhipicephalus appendiculatus]
MQQAQSIAGILHFPLSTLLRMASGCWIVFYARSDSKRPETMCSGSIRRGVERTVKAELRTESVWKPLRASHNERNMIATKQHDYANSGDVTLCNDFFAHSHQLGFPKRIGGKLHRDELLLK